MSSEDTAKEMEQRSLFIVVDNQNQDPDDDLTKKFQVYFTNQNYQVKIVSWKDDPYEHMTVQIPHLILLVAFANEFQQSLDMVRQLRNNPSISPVPIIYVGERDERLDRLAVLTLGVEDYLTIPFDIEELQLRINNKISFARRQHPALHNKPKILVVEDDFDISNMLQIYFTGQGYEVEVAARGYDGLDMCRTMRPDLLVLDIMLPDIDGYEVCRIMRTTLSLNHIPVLFLTQKDERSDKIAGLELGADDYMTKPFDIEELNLRIKMILDSVRVKRLYQQEYKQNNQPSISNIELRNILREYFNLSELRDLCFDLGVRYDDFPEQTRNGIARELVSYFERRQDLDRVIILCRQLRPKVF